MNITSSSAPVAASRSSERKRALVLGGGGSTGNAWLIGLIAGLFDAGLDVTDADLVIGTSAGATAAAQLSGASPADLFAAIVASAPSPPPQPVAPDQERVRSASVADRLGRMRAMIAASESHADMCRRLGAAAIEVTGDPEQATRTRTRWRATVAARLPSPGWPERRMFLTAVDANTGEPIAFNRSSGIDLVDAVAASCAGGGFAYPIGDHHYIDGGYRSNPDNADLAAGHERVLVLSPLGGESLFPKEWGMQLAAQVETLRADGSRVETIFPDGSAAHLFGANAMDVSLRPAAARVGFDQGGSLAERLKSFWL